MRTSLCAPTKVQTTLGNSMESHEMPFLHPTLEPIQVARNMVEALDSGLSHYMVMPGFMKVLPLLRGMPYWFRRVVDEVSVATVVSLGSICEVRTDHLFAITSAGWQDRSPGQ